MKQETHLLKNNRTLSVFCQVRLEVCDDYIL